MAPAQRQLHLFFIALAALNEVLWRGIDLFMVQYFAGLLVHQAILPSKRGARRSPPSWSSVLFYNVAVVAPASGQN